MMKFLVKYEIHAKVISVEETELTKVKNIIKESFNIEDDIIIQRFDTTWEEFIDINCNEDEKF
jgi:ribosomal protein S13